MTWSHFLSGVSIVTSLNDTSAPRTVHDVVTFSLWGFYCDISEWHVRSTNGAWRGHIFSLGFLLWHLWMTRPLHERCMTWSHFLSGVSIVTSLNDTSAPRTVHDVVTFSLWGFYCDISEWHVRSTNGAWRGHIFSLGFLLWHLWMTRPLHERWTPPLMFAPN